MKHGVWGQDVVVFKMEVTKVHWLSKDTIQEAKLILYLLYDYPS